MRMAIDESLAKRSLSAPRSVHTWFFTPHTPHKLATAAHSFSSDEIRKEGDG